MLKNLLHPNWQHSDATIRRRAIEEGRLDADILFELAKTDPEAGIRALAVSHMQDLQQLIALAECTQDAVDAGVPARLHDLILAADPQIVPDMQTLQRCYELCSAEQQRLSLLLHAPYAALRQMAAEGVHQDEALEQCVMNDKAGEVRRAAVLRIVNEDILRHIAKQLRASDKTTARLADEVRAQLRQQRDRLAQRRQMLTELQAYSEGTKPLNEAVIDKYTREWKNIAADVDGEDKDRFDALQATLQPQLEHHRHQQQQEREGWSLREGLLQSLAELAEHGEQSDPKELEQRLITAEARWQELTAMQNTGAQQRFEQNFQEAIQRTHGIIRRRHQQAEVQHRLDSAIASLEARLQAQTLTTQAIKKAQEQRDGLIDSIKDRQTFEKPLQQVRNLVEKLENKLAEQQSLAKTLQGKLKTHIDALESALRDKTLKPALAAHKKAHDLLTAAGNTRPASLKSLEQRLHHSEPALRELKSWRNWGTDHAREELIKEATALRDAPPANVEKLAKSLTDLRTRWKALGPLEPGGKAHWEQFDAACTQAHEPVKAKHDADAEARRKHLEQRKTICRQLEELITCTDWEQPDWHALDRAMSEARRQWNRNGGVPHKDWQAIRKRFDHAIKELDSHLEQERERNFSFRQRLVQKAVELAQEQDSRAATAAARELRQQWQVSVHSHSRKEKQIWQAFSKAMDQVFLKDRAAREQFKASLDENQHKAEALCEQLEQLARSDDQTISSRRAELQPAIKQFAALNLPKQIRRQLENRFDKACKALEQRIISADHALRRERLEQLYALHCLCAQIEAVALGQPPDAQTASGFQAQWSEAEKPAKEKSALHNIETRYQAALAVIKGEQAAEVLGDLAENAHSKRAICTDLEILLHLESPEAERSQRMQRQIEILENAMKGGDQNSPDRIRKLMMTYLSCGPTEPALQAELEKRFSILLHASM
jgi:hypothetical protein